MNPCDSSRESSILNNYMQKEVKLVPLDYIIDFCNTVTDWEAIYEKTGELPAKDDCYSCKIEE